MVHAALGDPVGGLNAAAALMLGFMHRKNTGEGQHIDLSQVECMLPLVAPSIIEQSSTGKSGPRIGNRHPVHVPHGCFPCIGEDQWITLAVRSDAEWQSLCHIMHRPDLAADPSLASAEGRRAEEDRIEVAIRHWTSTVRPDLAMVTLQAAGIAGRRGAAADGPARRSASGESRPLAIGGSPLHGTASVAVGRLSRGRRRVALCDRTSRADARPA